MEVSIEISKLIVNITNNSSPDITMNGKKPFPRSTPIPLRSQTKQVIDKKLCQLPYHAQALQIHHSANPSVRLRYLTTSSGHKTQDKSLGIQHVLVHKNPSWRPSNNEIWLGLDMSPGKTPGHTEGGSPWRPPEKKVGMDNVPDWRRISLSSSVIPHPPPNGKIGRGDDDDEDLF
ncbi:hypothetical protein DPMN_093713 [Dreissena polymorpha]|uniref:Uncharacterized protein n=1 Tax=Dreissena polymorpha TaxID=45954 RepID=A0A9D4R194_DREPO|nr:hypothetical protein DPMN_093713 [Dreissena polymorpha]